MTVIHNATIGDIIKAVADRYGADVLLCEACAWIESRFNPLAVGDGGTSFGLYQLHEGGELGDLTPAQAENPLTNCRVAIPAIASVEHAHKQWSPGTVAAFAQRPANQTAYAIEVDGVYNAVKAGKPPVGYLVARNHHAGVTIDDPDHA